jgi:hypothetical protein
MLPVAIGGVSIHSHAHAMHSFPRNRQLRYPQTNQRTHAVFPDCAAAYQLLLSILKEKKWNW